MSLSLQVYVSSSVLSYCSIKHDDDDDDDDDDTLCFVRHRVSLMVHVSQVLDLVLASLVLVLVLVGLVLVLVLACPVLVNITGSSCRISGPVLLQCRRKAG